MRYIVLFIWMIFFSQTYGNVIPQKIYKNPIILYNTQNKKTLNKMKEIFSQQLNFLCFDFKGNPSEVLDVSCRNFWDEKSPKYACWIEQVQNDQSFLWTCRLQVNDTKTILFEAWFEVYKKLSNIDGSQFPKYYDISNNFFIKSIQAKSLSCESSAAADILSTLLTKHITEDDVITLLPKSWYNQSAILENGKRYWWNPEVGFVGHIDQDKEKNIAGKQWKYEWYGVYEAPLQKVFSYYGFSTEILNAYNQKQQWFQSPLHHLTYLLSEITKGNYVQLWGDICTYRDQEDWNYLGKMTTKKANEGKVWYNRCDNDTHPRILSWHYRDELWNEKYIKWLNWQHAFYLLWYRGNITDPTHIIVWDTTTGKHTYSLQEWLRKWERMEYRSLVIFKK